MHFYIDKDYRSFCIASQYKEEDDAGFEMLLYIFSLRIFSFRDIMKSILIIGLKRRIACLFFVIF